MKPTKQTNMSSKKRPVQPAYEEEEIQPTIQQSAFTKKQQIVEPVVIDVEENKENFDESSNSEDEENMSPQLLSELIAATTPRPSDSQIENKRNFEEMEYHNSLFHVELYQRKQNFSAVMELKLSPPMDNHGHPNLIGFQECPLPFKVLLTGRWAQ